MAINVSFNGATIYKPGSYSRTTIDLGGGFPLGPAGLVAVIGEADAGAPGANEVNIANNRFTADQLSVLRGKYRSGPLADAAGFLFAPAADAAIPSGAQTIWLYKTNASVRASLALASTYGTVRAREWGVGGNRLSFKNVLVSETPPTTASTAAFNETTLLAAQTLIIRQNGSNVVSTFTLASPPTNNADLAAQLALAGNWAPGLPSGISIVVGGVNGASTITITQAASVTQHQLGWGRSFEISGTMLVPSNLVAGLKTAVVEPSATITLDQKRDLVQESETLGGNIVLELGHDGTGAVTNATVTIDATNIILNQNGSPVFTLPKSSYATLKDLVDELSLVSYGGWSASLSSALYNQLSPEVLDQVTAVGALSTVAMAKPARIKKDAFDVELFFEQSSLAEIVSQEQLGLPDALAESLLAGGARGATTSASIVAALEKFEKFHVNFVLPLFARDATADIADDLTDSGSTYTIDGIHQAVKTHLSLMKTTKRKSERQSVLALKDSFVSCKEKAGDLADGRIQLVIQDVRQNDASGVIKWFQPWAMAALLTGARSGAPIGEPMTFKFLNLAGIRHTAQAMSVADADIVQDFDPDLQSDEAIIAGITFLEAPQTGGFRIVVDNTTYGRDGNFVWNRANVIYAADIVAFNFRNVMESTFVGRKNTVSSADVVGVASSTLNTFLRQGITVSTPDAPQGFKGLLARIEGNTIYVEVTIKIVEGIDFVLSDIFVQRATQ